MSYLSSFLILNVQIYTVRSVSQGVYLQGGFQIKEGNMAKVSINQKKIIVSINRSITLVSINLSLTNVSIEKLLASYKQLAFFENFQKVKDHNNQGHHTYPLYLNQFSDLTEEEFVEKVLMKSDLVDLHIKQAISSNSTSSAIVRSASKSTRWPAQCLDYASKFGITIQQNYPYVAVQKSCNFTGTSNRFKPNSWKKIPNTPQDLQNALNNSPVSVIVDASTWGHYRSGIYNGCSQTNIQLNHAVLAIGYDPLGNWIVKNSWGTRWGEQGYIRLSLNNTCGILSYNLQIAA
ncbi:hypothetical protein ABPG72_013461 [Tetrahymena utriculariae]